MTSTRGCGEFYLRLFRKLYEDLLEAYMRTPVTISSRPYIERALRLVQAGYTAAAEEAGGAPRGFIPGIGEASVAPAGEGSNRRPAGAGSVDEVQP